MTNSSFATLKKAWALLDHRERKNAFKVLILMILSAFGSAIMVGSIFPFLAVLGDPAIITENRSLAWLYDTGDFQSAYDFIVALGIGTVAVVFLSNVLLIVQVWAVARYTQLRIASISRRLLSHYLGQPYEFFLGRHSGDISTNILSEAQVVVKSYFDPLAQMISAVLTSTAVLGALLLVEPVLGSITIGVFAAAYGLIGVFTRRYVARAGQRRAAHNMERFRIAGEAIGGVKDIKLLGCESAYLNRFSVPAIEMARTQIGVRVIAQVPRYAIQLIVFAGLIYFCLLFLDSEDLQERQALGDFLPMIGLLAFGAQRVMPELQKLHHGSTMMKSGAAAVERVHDDLSLSQGVAPDLSTAAAPLSLSRELRLDGVTYRYPNSDRAGVQDVTLTIHAGERIGIVGGSGAGKTTLADVVLGLLPAHAGKISVDGTEITQSTMRAWQKTVGYVPQDIFLTEASLSENIALGICPDKIDHAKIERAARVARLHNLAVLELSDGYATLIGERGVRLSGGQRQRIGIARAMYHDADLIVFDEATSALDNLTERDVMTAVDGLPGDKTIMLIAHRLSTIKTCDRIVVMEAGKVVGIGTWDELAASNPAFQSLSAA